MRTLKPGYYRHRGTDGASLLVRVEADGRIVIGTPLLRGMLHAPMRITPNRDTSITIYNDAAKTGFLDLAEAVTDTPNPSTPTEEPGE